MKKIFLPFGKNTKTVQSIVLLSWLAVLVCFWIINSFSDINLFPTPKQVLHGLVDLWNGGLMTHIFSSLILCAHSIFYSVLISLVFAYLSVTPFFKPIGQFISKLRYLPLAGITYYLAIVIHDARELQVWVLVCFMTTFLTTSLLQMILDIPEEEFSHARTLGCSRLETLWEVIIKGRVDYVFELVRQNLAIVWMMLVSVESILAATGGLGFLIKNNDKLADNGKVIALQLIIVLLGILLDFGITKLRKLIFRYSNY